MRYRTLGRTGIKVSPYALGALALGTPIGNPDHDDSVRIIHKALDAGINFIDTSDAYGESEAVVGKALKRRRDAVVLATKFSRPIGDDPNHQGASRRWIMTAVENSLRRLQIDHIDLYQVHRPDPDTDIEETLSALSDLIHSGKVRAVGTMGWASSCGVRSGRGCSPAASARASRPTCAEHSFSRRLTATPHQHARSSQPESQR
jgi:aryl-alcohol dehydrogenase-like predicted oxidoreductase